MQANGVRELVRQFESDVRAVLARAQSEKEIVEGIKPLFAELLTHKELVPDEYRKPLPNNKYAQYLLYKPDDDAFSLIAFIWGPGNASPVHDHRVWGLVGMMDGKVQERKYRRLDDGSDPSYAKLEHVETIVCKPGDISHVYPPMEDIHDVSNPFDEVGVTVHIYGADIGKQERYIYDVETGAVKPVITRHLNEKAVWA